MKLLRKQQLVKILAGAGLVLLAAFITVFIRDALNLRAPENALPQMDVYHTEEDRLPAEHIRRDSYTWQFLFWPPVSGGGLDLEVWREIPPGWVNPIANLRLDFSFEPKDVRVYMAAGESAFVELSGNVFAPDAPGTYTYRVDASWGSQRVVTYFFRIRVPVWN